ncbi:MAG: hypothetical protein ACTHLE_01580 [Agriterribacter sp.]
MKNIPFPVLLLAILVLTQSVAFAQSKIKDGTVTGSTNLPHAAALVEFESNNKGVLLPRVELTATNNALPLAAHVPGMMVYNTATAGTAPNNVTPGFYYNTGSAWARLIADNSGKADTTNDGWKDDAANAQVRLAYKSDGSTIRDAGTEFVIKDDGNVGIGASSPKSTLTVNGSYEGTYNDVSSNTTLTSNNQYINLTGPNVTVTLPDASSEDFSGRVYTIKNSTSTAATIQGFGGQYIQSSSSTGPTTATSFTVGAGSVVQIVKSNYIGAASAANPAWTILFNTESYENNTKAVQYVSKTVSPINANTPTNSVLSIGNLLVRFNGSNTSPNNVEFASSTPTFATFLYHKAGSGGENLENWGKVNITGSTDWQNFQKFTTTSGNTTPDINPGNRDIGYALIIFHNTRETYRLTINVSGDIPSEEGIPAASSAVTFFVEKLN